MTTDDEARFWKYVDRRGPDDCWEWTGARWSKPPYYGRAGDGNGGTAYAHRLSWTIHNGPIPRGLFVCHKCDNGPCVNPAHLFIGTAKDNLQDMISKGRAYLGGRPRTITQAQLDQVWRLRGQGYSCPMIAETTGISNTTIIGIVRGSGYPKLRYSHTATGPDRRMKLSDSQVDEIIAKHNAGKNYSELAREYGISNSHVNRLCKKASRRNRSTPDSPFYFMTSPKPQEAAA